MANPFLVLGGIAVGVITATFGVLAVPGWIASAQNVAALNDLAALTVAEVSAVNATGDAAPTVAALDDGDYGLRFTPTPEVCSVIGVSGKDFVLASRHTALSTWHARINGGPIASGSTLSAAVDGAGGLPTGVALPDPLACGGTEPFTDAPVPLDDSQWYVLRDATGSVCLDGSAAATPCALQYDWPAMSQFWQMIPVKNAGASVVTIRPRHTPTTRLQAGEDVTLTAYDGAALAQRWRLERLTRTGDLRIVSMLDGRCLHLPSSAGASVSLGSCNDAQARVADHRERLAFDVVDGRVALGIGLWTAGLNVQQRPSGGSWENMVAGPIPQTQIAFDPAILPPGEIEMRLFIGGATAYTFTIHWDGDTVTPGRGFN